MELGIVVGTPDALAELENAGVIPQNIIARHAGGDWGNLSEGDKAANDLALKTGERILSSYNLLTGVKVWVVTEWDRSATTVLLPDEY